MLFPKLWWGEAGLPPGANPCQGQSWLCQPEPRCSVRNGHIFLGIPRHGCTQVFFKPVLSVFWGSHPTCLLGCTSCSCFSINKGVVLRLWFSGLKRDRNVTLATHSKVKMTDLTPRLPTCLGISILSTASYLQADTAQWGTHSRIGLIQLLDLHKQL